MTTVGGHWQGEGGGREETHTDPPTTFCRTVFFPDPHINTHLHFTIGNPHVSLKGMVGSTAVDAVRTY